MVLLQYSFWNAQSFIVSRNDAVSRCRGTLMLSLAVTVESRAPTFAANWTHTQVSGARYFVNNYDSLQTSVADPESFRRGARVRLPKT